jgi:glutaredoxin
LRVPDDLLLVTNEDCSYCTRAQDVLAELGIEARMVDVASDEADELARRGIPLAFLPVLTDGESVIAYGRFSSRRLARKLAA